MDNPQQQVARILPLEVGTFVVISLVFFFAMVIGDANGVGVFQQPESNLIAPILLGILFNGLLMYLIVFRIIIPFFLSQQYLRMAVWLVGLLVIALIIKTGLHVALIHIAYPALKVYTLYDLAEENFYFVMPVGVFAILYGLVRASILKRIHNIGTDPTITITSGKKIYRFKTSKIKYIKSEGNYVKVFADNQSPLLYSSLNTLEETLPGETFLRIHRSYIISVNYIAKIEAGSITIDTTTLPIGQKYMESVRSKLAAIGKE